MGINSINSVNYTPEKNLNPTINEKQVEIPKKEIKNGDKKLKNVLIGLASLGVAGIGIGLALKKGKKPQEVSQDTVKDAMKMFNEVAEEIEKPNQTQEAIRVVEGIVEDKIDETPILKTILEFCEDFSSQISKNDRNAKGAFVDTYEELNLRFLNTAKNTQIGKIIDELKIIIKGINANGEEETLKRLSQLQAKIQSKI